MLAIDFGTSNTVVAHWDGDRSRILSLPGLSRQDPNNPPIVPSQLYVEDAKAGQVVVGQAASDRGLDVKSDPRYFRNFKRGIGVDVRGFIPELDGVEVTPEQVGTWFLQAIVRAVQAKLGPDETDSWVFTVPVDSFEAYRQWLSHTVSSLGIEQLQLLDEPTAAALEYSLLDSRKLLIVDFGGGTLDLALVQPAKSTGGRAWGTIVKWGSSLLKTDQKQATTAKVLAKAAQTLGGADIDRWLAEAWCQMHNLQNNRLITRLAERVKMSLSTDTEATEVFFDDETFRSVELSAQRSQLDSLLRHNKLFERLETALDRVLLQARQRGISRADISAVVAVGGTCKIPAIRAWLDEQFGSEKVFDREPLEAIAKGALQLGRGIEVRDFLYHSYGIRYWNHQTNSHDWHPLIQAGLPYPLPDPVELVLGASVRDQPSVELVIGELGESNETVEVYFADGQLLARQRSNDRLQTHEKTIQALNDEPEKRTIAQLNPLGQPGSDRLLLQFQVDEQRRLCVTVEDLLTAQILQKNQPIIELR
ncbi:Hsp70 family protein [Synechococcus sp. PCC 7336]|uniref:Hsp70 family protein n=1 Tax=Synechococcus sp. PCC 7336 TaxID=195250 RepID=UPI00034DD256|nr:Hsp70 family protein [Synechococcus sp. PCC 7336]